MVLLLYKWLLLLSPIFSAEPASAVPHPFYVSVTEINHNAADKTFEISCKLFTEDTEQSLNNIYKTKVDFYTEKGKEQAEKLLLDYMSKHLAVFADGKYGRLELVGFEREKEAVWVYLQVSNVQAPKRITVQNTILYEFHEEQINLVHVTVNGIRKSGKTISPEREMKLEF
jgi:hypothetical protein